MTETKDISRNRKTAQQAKKDIPKKPIEQGGRGEGPDPTRFGDWEKNGKCVDF